MTAGLVGRRRRRTSAAGGGDGAARTSRRRRDRARGRARRDHDRESAVGQRAGHRDDHRRADPGRCAWPPAVGCSTTRSWGRRRAGRGVTCHCRRSGRRGRGWARTRRRPAATAGWYAGQSLPIDRLGRRPRWRCGRHRAGQPHRRPTANVPTAGGCSGRELTTASLAVTDFTDPVNAIAIVDRRPCGADAAAPVSMRLLDAQRDARRRGEPVPPQVLVDGVRTMLLYACRRPGRTRGCPSTVAPAASWPGCSGQGAACPRSPTRSPQRDRRGRRAAARRRSGPSSGQRSRSATTHRPRRPRSQPPVPPVPRPPVPRPPIPVPPRPVKKVVPAKKVTPAKKTPAKKTPAKKTPAKKTPATKTPAKKVTPAKKAPPPRSASDPRSEPHDDHPRVLRAVPARPARTAGRRLHRDK